MTQPLGPPDPSTPDDFAREALVIQRLRDTLPADGVPCGTSDADCETCGRALGWLSRLRAEIAGTAP